ncbi:ectoine/hydroxyectoine ABC transporter ATP-binding protein EhuA [Saccharopolyspora rhizosphaerae]|uniref:Ectoine/hydroxyectoine ABC transporter ATP-binding protein EhuA n=1 Tax=Saccharopolyspora rhizosphaerae TaxID=2492662 RepID=A0A3R8NX94_9PSEU|nr:ectoine/hydroxyectoine ABC transporter ATP-binding protein EhuA [Saccharopolyspora rhizosphaerae]RRO14960.1 ectoine/hydroxyectoine ABC transporter ATP-binding protein EhuA [Saccharopolyspora rhizosphaerae]
MISFAGVGKSFGDNHVLRDLDVTVAPGEKVSIIGPSGSGKTTILRLLMTLESPDTGLVEVDGEPLWDCREGARTDLKKQAEVRRKIGMVFQHFNLFPHMTVLDNVTLSPVRVLGMGREEAGQRAVDLLQLVGLEKHMSHKPGQLSGGQQQRVAIARALAMRPKVMLFDEVTSALDPELIGEVLAVIRDLAHTTAMTMLLVTHEMRFAEEISDRVLMFDSGSVIESGPPAQILQHPQHERTRRFLKAVLERK